MTTISADIIIAAPADAVWEVLAHRFDQIGEWATVVPESIALSGPPAAGAPVAGRVCHTGIRMAPAVTERIVAYDPVNRTFTYQAERLPGFIKTARNQWRVEAIDDHHSRAGFQGTFEPRGVIGRIGYLALRIQLARTIPQLLDDLAHYVEHGRPSTRKQRRLTASKQ